MSVLIKWFLSLWKFMILMLFLSIRLVITSSKRSTLMSRMHFVVLFNNIVVSTSALLNKIPWKSSECTLVQLTVFMLIWVTFCTCNHFVDGKEPAGKDGYRRVDKCEINSEILGTISTTSMIFFLFLWSLALWIIIGVAVVCIILVVVVILKLKGAKGKKTSSYGNVLIVCWLIFSF